MRKLLRLTTLVLLTGLSLQAFKGYSQDVFPITTAVPFLLISPDARGGSMGETGVATEPDAASIHWNPAKYAFIEKDMGFAVSYSPWLRELVDDIGLAYVSGYKKFDDRQAIAGSLRYFSLGTIQFTRIDGTPIGDFKPNEFALDLAYSRKFSDNFSGSVTGRFIYSNLTLGQEVQGAETSAGTSVAADVAIYYRKEFDLSGKDAIFSFGTNISNIGAKISYTQTTEKDFIPTNLRLGPSLSVEIDDYNSIGFQFDITKLLIPTTPIYKKDPITGQPIYDENNKLVIDKGYDPNVSILTGMVQSFYDAPNGMSEEFKEIIWAAGAEYWYNKQFALRAGYYHESEEKGARQFMTFGAGLRYNVFGLDFSYLVSTDQRNPLDNTLRFTLTFDFEAFRSQGR
jgi:hypothetical protein